MSNIRIPRRKDDVEIDYHDHQYHHERPMLNVKVYGGWGLDRQILKWEHEGHEFSGIPEFWAWLHEHDDECDHDSRCEFNVAWEIACESAWEFAADDLADCRDSHYFPGYNATLYQTGRSGGWLVVKGLPPVSEWDAVMLSRWKRFAREMSYIVDDVPYQWIWHLYANFWEPLHEAEVAAAQAQATEDAAAQLPAVLIDA